MTFDSREPGTAATRWRRSDPILTAAAADPAPFASLVVVAAHPDDETLMAGGLIARFARSGRPVTVVLASDGAASHPDSPTTTRERLATIRADELVRALDLLAPGAPGASAPGAHLIRLDLPDGHLADHVARIAHAVADAADPSALVVSTWETDGHIDHEAVARAARDAADSAGAAHWQAPIWLWHWGDPGETRLPPLARLALSPEERAAKARASAAHESQTQALSDRPGDERMLSPEFLEHFAGDSEFYVGAAAEPVGSALGRGFFDDFYSGADDPWGFESRWYERRKRDITLAVLPRERFASALELGCSIGVTTAELAGRCDDLLAVDIAERPLDIARRRLAEHPRVRFERRTLPAEWPLGRFDLIVVSEVGYYLDLATLRELVRRSAAALTEKGVLVVCHWRHPVAEYPLTGDTVHEAFSESGLASMVQHIEADFRLDVYSADRRSVAESTGLA
ncbi:MAG: bifunctional PIG-L family deacetylase/class I SAM-dependent methyltransferase [Naasia sp.]